MQSVLIWTIILTSVSWTDGRTLRRPPDFEEHKIVIPLQPEKNPDELSGFIEGDIVILGKVVSDNEHSKWRNGAIPFVIDETYSTDNVRMIIRALSDIQSVTCLVFSDRTDEQDYISFKPVDGCSSQIGLQGGEQTISLTDSCFFPGVILHEIMHTLGFWHEHNRIDRDDFVRIEEGNIVPGFESNFDKYSSYNFTTMGENYDYGSIMHGSNNMLAKNGTKTIVPIPDENVKIGQRVALSPLDIKKLNRFYECPVTGNGTDTLTTPQPELPTTDAPVTQPDLSNFCINIPGYDLVPNPQDCTTFFVCWNGITQLSHCPDGLYFNPEFDVCDWPGNVACTLIAVMH